jgi:signal transduction histidine kinase
MKLPGESREELKTITECVERTEAILGEFKRFVAPLTLNAQPCDPCDVMHRAARRVGDELKTITLECDFPPGETTIVADAQLIGEAVEELLINATRALKGRGTIRLAVRSATEVPAQLLPQRNNRQCVVLSVEDNGPGIKPEHAQRIFEPFFSTTVGGTGLGLSIVRRTVEAHGGVVREVGTYGKGARFELFLPMKGGDSDGEIQGSDS